MSGPIKPGDLVVVVGVHCEGSSKDWLGLVRTVASLRPVRTRTCHYCKAPVSDAALADFVEGQHLPVSLLKRIPPLSDLEGEKRDEKLTERQ
jgi:hypothetical protein